MSELRMFGADYRWAEGLAPGCAYGRNEVTL